MSHSSTCATQVFFLHDWSKSVLSLLWVFPFCGVPFDGAPFLGVSFLDLLVGLSPRSFPCLEECFQLLMGLFILGLTSSAHAGGFSVTVHALQWGPTTEPVGGGTSGDFLLTTCPTLTFKREVMEAVFVVQIRQQGHCSNRVRHVHGDHPSALAL